MFLLSVYTYKKFYTSYTHIYIHRAFLLFDWKWPNFGRNVVFNRPFLPLKISEDSMKTEELILQKGLFSLNRESRTFLFISLTKRLCINIPLPYSRI